MTREWIYWLSVLGVGMACVGVTLWVVELVSSAPFMDYVCLRCGITEADERGCCVRCGMAVELEEREERKK
jgi:DNA-directed RNA polymerase subunit RPC12/RpoP